MSIDAKAEFDWDELLVLIEDRSVIPVIGRELLVLALDSRQMLLEHYLAGRLAEALQLPRERLSEKPDVNEVSILHLSDAGVKGEIRKRLIQKRIEGMMSERVWRTPEPLRELAAITHFSLFVSTTSDPLLNQAINEFRFDGAPRAQQLAFYNRRTPDDIPSNRPEDDAYIYRIFGAVESSIDFAVTDEDRIETLHRLQDNRLQPPNLFDELREKNLLFIGCGFADGLTRILARTLNNKRLFGSSARNKVADTRAYADVNLISFLEHCGTEIYVPGDAVEFTRLLCEKWRASLGSCSGADTRRGIPGAPAPSPPPGLVFLSYKSEDVDRVARLKDALEKAGLFVWFDKQALQGGDDWNDKIDKAIESCTLFIPIISRKSQTAEGECRREWYRALRRAERIPPEVPFIMATLIDDRSQLRYDGGTEPILIPKEFWAKQTLRCQDGDSADEFVRAVRTQMRQAQLLRRGL